MNFKQKVVIFLAAILLTLVGFNLIVSPAVDILKVGKQAGYEIISNYLAKADAAAHHPLIKG
jgi:Tfp pilus assembly protein PilO